MALSRGESRALGAEVLWDTGERPTPPSVRSVRIPLPRRPTVRASMGLRSRDRGIVDDHDQRPAESGAASPVPLSSASGGTPTPARGRRVAQIEFGIRRRYSPACAGTTACCRRCKRPGPVHPRLRGDDPMVSVRSLSSRGTPPPARGRRHGRLGDEGRLRYTPACAGTTPARAARIIAVRGTPPPARGRRSRRRRSARSLPVHPRLRGDVKDGRCLGNAALVALTFAPDWPGISGNCVPSRESLES